jgi:putative endonuclease
MYWTYALYSESADKIYVGQSDNLEKRVAQHNGLYKFRSWTKRYKPWELFYSEGFETRKEAILRENELKTGIGREFLRQKLNDFKKPELCS